jgi:hypothetical protein
MATPLRYDLTLPDGQPLRFDTPGARWDGTVEYVMAASESQNNKTTMNQNLVSAALTAQTVTNINTAIATIRTNLPFLLNLTPEQRRTLQHAASSGQGVLQDTLTFVAQHPEALPATFSTAEFAKDGALLSPFAPVVAAMDQLNTDVNDTFVALQADLYSQFLDVYAFAKANNRNGAYDSYLDSVKGRFAKGPRSNIKNAKPAPATA